MTDRLATLRTALTHVTLDAPALEFGVASGESLRLIAETLAPRQVCGFDSFDGLPQHWRPGFDAGMFRCAPPADLPANAELVVGLFADTLPTFAMPDAVSLVHVDCDLYESTCTVLAHVPLVSGTVIVFDEHHGYPGWEQHEAKAWREYLTATEPRVEVIASGPEQLACLVV